MGILVKIFTLMLVSIETVKPDTDYHLCGHRWADNGDFYSDPDDKVQPIHIKSFSGQADLLYTVGSSSGSTTVSSIVSSLPTGLFNTAVTNGISQGDFCNGNNDEIYVADMDGDHYDDLLCRKSDGAFSVRYFRSRRFSPPKPFAQDFQCGTQADTKVVIGDYDGNHADDILCYDITAANFDSSPVYFSQANCHHHLQHPSSFAMMHHGYFGRGYGRSRRDYNQYSNYHRSGGHFNCEKGLPMITALSAGLYPGCVPNDVAGSQIFSMDANGDGKDDIACFRGTSPNNNIITMYLSTGSRLSIFEVELATSGCYYASYIKAIPIDLDGDGDDDLICADNEVHTSSNAYPVSFFTNGDFQVVFNDAAAIACAPNRFCLDTTLSTAAIATFYVGDYNGDGKEDLMCRYLSSGKMHTRIVFAEYYS